MTLIQFATGGSWSLLRLFKHLKHGIEGITQLCRSYGATADTPGRAESDFYRTIGVWDQNSGSQFNLNCAIHNAMGTRDIKIDEGRAASILVDNRHIGSGSVGSIHNVFQSVEAQLRKPTT